MSSSIIYPSCTPTQSDIDGMTENETNYWKLNSVTEDGKPNVIGIYSCKYATTKTYYFYHKFFTLISA